MCSVTFQYSATKHDLLITNIHKNSSQEFISDPKSAKTYAYEECFQNICIYNNMPGSFLEART